jgi:hypothetical protein
MLLIRNFSLGAISESVESIVTINTFQGDLLRQSKSIDSTISECGKL